MDTIQLDQRATVGDAVYVSGRYLTVSDTVCFDGWRDYGRLEPVEPDLLDALAPYAFRLRSNCRGPATVYPGGVVFHGAARLETTGRAIVRHGGAHWLRCRVELWDGFDTKTLRGLVRLD